jgi:hypothetical protein
MQNAECRTQNGFWHAEPPFPGLMPTLTIDGVSVTAPEGATILDAARSLNVDVPTLC